MSDPMPCTIGSLFKLTVKTDDFLSETIWKLVNSDTSTKLWSGGPHENTGKEYKQEACIPSG